MVRALASLAALSLAALALTGCPEENEKPEHGAGKNKPASHETAKAGHSAAPAAAEPSGASSAKPAAGGEAKFGTATIKGVVNFAGKPLEMKVPVKRKDAEFCKTKEIKYNAVVSKDGKLQDVFVRITGPVKGDWKAPKKAEIEQKDCMYEPRMQGVVAGGEIEIRNTDGTMHNVHAYKGTETAFNQGQAAGTPPIVKELEDAKLYKFACDVHPWMRGFVVAVDHPFFAVSGADGTFTIEKVPAGKYEVEAWHSEYGKKTVKDVEVADGKSVEIKFDYSDKDSEPEENKDEMKGLW